MATIYIGIGSNLDDPVSHVRQAVIELKQLRDCHFLAVSGLYKSRPLESPLKSRQLSPPQPDYINAVIAIKSNRDRLSLLDDLQAIESQHGRVRNGEHWGPRTLDLDVLLIGDKIINETRLIIPHPGLHERSFVLYPLQEIAPDLLIPDPEFAQRNDGKEIPLGELIAQCDDEGLERISDA